VDPSGERTVYLPHGAGEKLSLHGSKRSGQFTDSRAAADAGGDWVDFWTGTRHAAGQCLKLKVPLSRIPIFVRAGAILPLMAKADRIPEGPIDKLAVRVYAGAESTWTLLEDEGRTRFELTRHGNRHTLASQGWRPQRDLKILWR
jgi:alpha-glucosidase (family GH31 glycosyl hydrolase)